jgi:hypothetical protein
VVATVRSFPSLPWVATPKIFFTDLDIRFSFCAPLVADRWSKNITSVRSPTHVQLRDRPLPALFFPKTPFPSACLPAAITLDIRLVSAYLTGDHD